MALDGVPHLFGPDGSPSTPLPASAPGTWAIWQFQLPIVGGLAGHNGFALVNPAGTVVAELNGLATNPRGEIIPIGTLRDQLRVYAMPNPYLFPRSTQSSIVLSGSYAQVVTGAWRAALRGGAAINAQRLRYPFLGFGRNSNSVASTLAACMGVDESAVVARLAPFVPGQGRLVLSQEAIRLVRDPQDTTPSSTTPAAGIRTQPRRITSYASALSTTNWHDHASLFQDGDPINGNPHHVRVRLRDGAFAIIRSHQPRVTRSNVSRATFSFQMVAALTATIASGLILGVPAVLAFAAVGTTSVAAAAGLRGIPADACWQGFTTDYYASAADKRPYTVQYYGWLRSASIHTAVSIDGETDPTRFSDFAKNADRFSWYRWRAESAPFREPATALAPTAAATSAARSDLPHPLTGGTDAARPTPLVARTTIV